MVARIFREDDEFDKQVAARMLKLRLDHAVEIINFFVGTFRASADTPWYLPTNQLESLKRSGRHVATWAAQLDPGDNCGAATALRNQSQFLDKLIDSCVAIDPNEMTTIVTEMFYLDHIDELVKNGANIETLWTSPLELVLSARALDDGLKFAIDEALERYPDSPHSLRLAEKSKLLKELLGNWRASPEK